MEAAMNILKGIQPWKLKDYVFLALVLLYVLGPLGYVASFVPTIWSLPAIFVVSGWVWRWLENKLSAPRIKPDGKAIFITGCDTGFGFELAKDMAGKGYDVYAGCLFPEGDGAKTLAGTANIFVVKCDVTKDDSMSDAANEVKQGMEKNGKTLWGVVANAGIALLGPFEWHTIEDIQGVFNVNVFGVVRTVKAFLPLLKGSKGRFVITGSSSGITSYQLLVAYSMTKAAVRSLTEGLRRETGRYSKVFFTSVMPSFHATPLLEKASEAELARRYNALPDEQRKATSPRYLERCQREHRSVMSLLTVKDLSGVARAFDHALTSVRPRPYYVVDRPYMHWVFYPVLYFFPQESADSMFQGFHKLETLLSYIPGARSRRKTETKTE